MLENNFRNYLFLELNKRKQNNYRYSLRQFAKYLGLEPSFLSKLLRGDRKCTLNQIDKLGKKLGLTVQEIDFYKVNSIKKTEYLERKNKRKPAKFYRIPFDSVPLIAGWHFFAILELYSMPDVEMTKNQISRFFNISELEAENAILHLVKLGLLEANNKNKFYLKNANTTIDQRPFTTKELRQIQKQFLLKSIDSLEQDPIDIRDHSGITLAISSSKISEAKKLIKNFRRRFMSLMQNVDPKDRIYQLSVSFYPISNFLSRGSK
tara:strand:- start:6359 stop:7150 length:792 start_codon:yes stop_codon:yes gene_type:complete